jgi:uncharacterized membrane protein YciS (DUF1049 family)
MLERISQRDGRQRERSVVVIVVIVIMITITALNTLFHYNNRLRTQATRKLTPPSAVQFVQGYRLEYVFCGFAQAQA